MVSVTAKPNLIKVIRISIIIPTYNRPDKLAACLNSISKQSISTEDFEVIVVDDGSDRDPGPAIANYHEHLHLHLITQDNSGPASARNTGVAVAQGEFIAFTDDDCLLHEDWLSEILSSLQSNPDALVGGKTINQLKDNIYSQNSQNLLDHLYDYHTRNNPELLFFPTNNMALTRQGFINAGGFDEGFPSASGEDREFCDRWLHHGNTLESNLEAIVYHCHDLNLAGFCELHYRYGKGARRFWRCRTTRGQGYLSIEKLKFYTSLLTHPWKINMPRPLFSSWLLALSQVANAAGYFSIR